jgi:hypothetical protein
MPTGYTADVADGKVTDFRTFALRCARAFGATIMQRDDPMDEPPRLREPSDYYPKAVAEAEQRLAELNAMTPDEMARAARADYEQRMASHRESEARKIETRNRYHAMLAEVVQWQPPTSEHVEFKNFMVKQLRESIDFDCAEWPAPLPMAPVEWWTNAVEATTRRLVSARQSLEREREAVDGTNQWITALYDSLSDAVEAR